MDMNSAPGAGLLKKKKRKGKTRNRESKLGLSVWSLFYLFQSQSRACQARRSVIDKTLYSKPLRPPYILGQKRLNAHKLGR